MDLIILARKIINAATLIDSGRKGFAIRGKEQEGRISYEEDCKTYSKLPD